MTDIPRLRTNIDAFTLRPFLFFLFLAVLLYLRFVFFKSILIVMLDGLLVLFFVTFPLIAALFAAFRRRWRRLISIILGAAAPIGVAYLGSLVSYALEPPIFHYQLSGPDWARIPKGYFGVLPERSVAELNIPKEYVERINGSTSQPQSEISIAIYYPSMKGAVAGGSSEQIIYAIISAGRETGFRGGVHSIMFAPGMIRDPSLDLNGLCGYVDAVHPVFARVNSYTSCDEARQIFSITCWPRADHFRACYEGAFLVEPLGAQLFYHDSLLNHHQAMLDAFKRLVSSFRELNAER